MCMVIKMYLLGICDNADIIKLLGIIKVIIIGICAAVPIILIVSLSLNFAKAIKLGEDELAKAKKNAIPKIIAAVLIFFIPMFVTIVISVASGNSETLDCLKLIG